MLLHHTLGNGNFNVFSDMSQGISCVMEKLNDPITVASQIDHALQQCWIQSRPVYLSLPTDVVQKKIEGERLKTPIDLSLPENDPDREAYVVDVVLKYLLAAKNPIILVDACAIRHRVSLIRFLIRPTWNYSIPFQCLNIPRYQRLSNLKILLDK